MKKILLGILLAALCLCLFGCAMGDGYGKYANIYRLLDAGDYEGAHAAIDALAGITPTTEPEIPVPVVPTTAPPETTEATEPAETTVPPTTAPEEPQPVDPSVATYVLNTSSKRIHKLKCSSVETIKAGNKVYTDLSREELIDLGYDPCGKCNP